MKIRPTKITRLFCIHKPNLRVLTHCSLADQPVKDPTSAVDKLIKRQDRTKIVFSLKAVMYGEVETDYSGT